MLDEVNKTVEERVDPKKLKLKDLSLSGHTVNPLVKRGIKTLNDVTRNTKGYYENIKYYRKSSLEELEKTLKKYGLNFKEDLLIKPIEDLGLSEQVYDFLKERKIDTVGKILKIELETFKRLSQKEATEILVKMKDIGIAQFAMSRLLDGYDCKKYMEIRMKYFFVQDNVELMEEMLPYVVTEFMLYMYSCNPKNYRKLLITEHDYAIEKNEEIYEEMKRIVKFFDSYDKKFTAIVKKEYKSCTCDFSSKDCRLMVKKFKEHFHETFEVLEEKKRLFYEITKEMENCSQLYLSDINKLKLYFPFVIESAVCRTFLPYTKGKYYIENEEFYEILYENLGGKMEIALKCVAKDVEKTTFSESIKPREKSSPSRSSSRKFSSSRSSSYYDSSYNSNSFGEKLCAEIAGTAMFLRGFLPF